MGTSVATPSSQRWPHCGSSSGSGELGRALILGRSGSGSALIGCVIVGISFARSHSYFLIHKMRGPLKVARGSGLWKPPLPTARTHGSSAVVLPLGLAWSIFRPNGKTVGPLKETLGSWLSNSQLEITLFLKSCYDPFRKRGVGEEGRERREEEQREERNGRETRKKERER